MEQLSRYTGYMGAAPITEGPDELIGRPLLSDTNEDKPCTTGIAVYHGISKQGRTSLSEKPREEARP